MVLSGISPSFPGLSQTRGQITHALLTRAPLVYPPKGALPYDLHVLSTPPAFVLSQDQTLQFKPSLDATLLCGVLSTTHFHVGRVVRNVDASLQPKCRAASQMGNTCPMAVNRAFPRSIDRTLFSFQRPSDTLRGLSGAPRAGAVRVASPPVETGHMNLRDTGHSVKSCTGRFRWNPGGLSPFPLGLKPA